MPLTKVNSVLVDGAINTDSSGNVGIGTSSPATKLDVIGAVRVNEDGAGTKVTQIRSNYAGLGPAIQVTTNDPLLFLTNNTERMRITSSGDVFINATSHPVVGIEKFGVAGGSTIAAAFGNSSASNPATFIANTANGTVTLVRFSSGSGGNTVGNITANGTNTTYSTSSDYRLKENISPMTGALDKVSALKPCTYTWKANGSDGQGFIAHELAEVCPDAVVGEKDAVDAEGNPIYQGIDTSFLVATLTAAIQELKAELDTVKTELATLKANP